MAILALVGLACIIVPLFAWFYGGRRSGPTAVPRGPPLGIILIIRHAEKPLMGTGLTPAGTARAQSYVTYFQHFQLDGQPVGITALIATADTVQSERPRLTLEPLSHALNIPIQQLFQNQDVADLAAWLASNRAGQASLVAWHHGKVPELLMRLGADPASVLPGGLWPDDVYDWVIVLRYDALGMLTDARCLNEELQ